MKAGETWDKRKKQEELQVGTEVPDHLWTVTDKMESWSVSRGQRTSVLCKTALFFWSHPDAKMPAEGRGKSIKGEKCFRKKQKGCLFTDVKRNSPNWATHGAQDWRKGH
ncbi:Protein Fam74A3-Like [Manis pentadactyla]|nr:Protein Fam74A3-Like [Manis pentadactyla]